MCGACGNPQHTWPWLCMGVGVTGNDSLLNLSDGNNIPGHGMAERGGLQLPAPGEEKQGQYCTRSTLAGEAVLAQTLGRGCGC